MAGNEGSFRPGGPSWADRWAALVGEEAPALAPRSASSAASRRSRTLVSQGRSMSQPGTRAPGMPTSIQDDLEDYLSRLDGLSQESAPSGGRNASAGGLPAEAPAVPRFGPEDLALLPRCRHGAVRSKYGCAGGAAAAEPDGPESSECPICLGPLRPGDAMLELPCGARHRFHESCIKRWLSKSVMCPLCRVDVKALLPKSGIASGSTSVAAGPATRRPRRQALPRRPSRPGQRSSAPGSGGQTLMGGTIVSYERDPPASWERPAYIPPHLRHLAQYFEVNYPGRGLARIWRVPNSATAELSRALPIEEMP